MQTTQMPSRAELVFWLEEDIARGDYGISGKLPSEVELMSRYAASRNTVRDALQDLQAAEIVEPRKRLGWFVRPDQRRDYPLADVHPDGWDSYCAREGLAGRREDVDVKRKRGEPVARFRCWQVRDAASGEWTPWALHLNSTSTSSRSDLSVTARAGTREELEALSLTRRSPVLEVNRAGERYVFDVRVVRLVVGGGA